MQNRAASGPRHPAASARVTAGVMTGLAFLGMTARMASGRSADDGTTSAAGTPATAITSDDDIARQPATTSSADDDTTTQPPATSSSVSTPQTGAAYIQNQYPATPGRAAGSQPVTTSHAS
jgi:hypothetical protein